MARHGLILRENEATSLRIIFKYLPDLRDIIFISKLGVGGMGGAPKLFLLLNIGAG